MPSRRLHPKARTTRKLRRQIQVSRDTDRACAERLGINVKTVAKWRRRDTVEDAPMGRRTPPRAALSLEQEVLVVAVRQLTWASLEVLLPRLQRNIPSLSRSALYRAWAKWGVSRTPRMAKPRSFPFARGESAAPGQKVVFEMRAVRLDPDQNRWMYFAVNARSGDIFAKEYSSLDGSTSIRFLKALLQMSPVEILITTCNQAFCNEENPRANWHPFRQFCVGSGIERMITSATPTPIGPLQEGWPGVDEAMLRRPLRRRSKQGPEKRAPRRRRAI